MLAVPDSKLDYLHAKLAIDRLIDPSINIAAATREVDQLTVAARNLAGATDNERIKMGVIRRVIYEAGPWNGNRPFTYDLVDPLGEKIHDNLLTTYLATRQGNCVSMPILFLILADRLGLNVSLATAPEHVFVRYTNPEGRVFDVETTSGANAARDEWYREKMPMSDRAVESGLYLRTLSRRENVALFASVEVRNLLEAGRYDDAVTAAAVVLKSAPRDADLLVMEGSAYGHMLNDEFIRKYPSQSAIPANLYPRYAMLGERNAALIDQAEALGWRPPDGQPLGAPHSK